MTEVLLGIDAGTSRIKVVAFDSNGTPLGASAVDTRTINPTSGWAEQDPMEVWNQTVDAVQEVTDALSTDIDAVGVTGQGGGCWLVDEEGDPVRNAIIWSDGRASDVVNRWQESGVYDELFQRCGYGAFAGLAVPILRWLRDHEPETLDAAATAFYCKDWLRSRLTGDLASDFSDVSLTGLSLSEGGLEPTLPELSQVSELADFIPPIRSSTAVAGRITADVAEETGLPEGCPVVTGAIDVAATAFGSGAIRPASGSVIVGTTLQTQILTESPKVTGPPVGYTLSLGLGGMGLRAMGAMAGTPNFDWMRENVATATDFDTIEERARGAPRGADGVLFHPYLSEAGEKAPFVEPEARAQYTGLSPSITRSHLLRAVYEGVALAVRDCYESLPVEPEITYLSGGGKRSELLCQLVSDTLDTRIRIPSGEELGARGAAMLAGVGVGSFSDLEAASESMTSVATHYEPRTDAVKTYNSLYERYVETYEAMRQVWGT